MDIRDYIVEQYRIAVTDYRLARTDDARHSALADMARLEQVAAEKIGFDFADSLKNLRA